MKETIYVFGFDNTLVNSEDIFVEAYNKVFDINITMEHWYEKFHSVKDIQTEFRMIEEEYNIKFTDEKLNETGLIVVETLSKKKPNENIYKLVKENEKTCHFLTGSPIEICNLYFKKFDINISEDRMHCGIYNGSGEKEKILENLQKKYDVIYIDDDSELVLNAKNIVTKAILLKQQYNKEYWNELETIDCQIKI